MSNLVRDKILEATQRLTLLAEEAHALTYKSKLTFEFFSSERASKGESNRIVQGGEWFDIAQAYLRLPSAITLPSGGVYSGWTRLILMAEIGEIRFLVA